MEKIILQDFQMDIYFKLIKVTLNVKLAWDQIWKFVGRIWKKKEEEYYSRFDILKGLEACLARRWNNSDRDKWPQVVEKKR